MKSSTSNDPLPAPNGANDLILSVAMKPRVRTTFGDTARSVPRRITVPTTGRRLGD
jgi:hypothetical protein